MTDEELRKSVHEALDHRLSGVVGDPRLAQRGLSAPEGEKPMKRKMTVSLALVLALTLLAASAAVAAGLGIFGQLAGDQHAPGEEQRLNNLDQVSENVCVTAATDDGVTVEIMQAYYEGSRVFISYRMSGSLYSAQRHEGKPEGEYSWDWTEKDYVISEQMGSINPIAQLDLEWLNGEGQRWLEARHVSMHDGLLLEDGTYLDIIGGDTEVQADGSEIGWKECVIPQEKLADTLNFKAVLFRTSSVMFQDGKDFYRHTERGKETDIPFTLRQNTQFAYLSGAAHTDVWQAAVDFTIGQIDMRGMLRLTCPQGWIDALDSWENPERMDYISDWRLYSGDALLSDAGLQSVGTEKDALRFELLYPRPQENTKLRLVPVYSESGEHPDEAIALEKTMNQ